MLAIAALIILNIEDSAAVWEIAKQGLPKQAAIQSIWLFHEFLSIRTMPLKSQKVAV